ncbi:MAG: DMT family transporter [Thermoplasmatales archaeon]
MKFKDSPRLDIILFFVMSVFWALNYPLLKIALFYEPPLFVLLFRVLFGAIFAIPFALGTLKLIKSVGILNLFIMSLLNVTMFMGLWFIGEKSESASISSIIIYTYPILSIIFSTIFLNEKLSIAKIASLVVGFTGIVLIFLNQIYVDYTIGLVLLIASALSWATGTVFYKKYLKNADLGIVNLFQFVFALPIVLVMALFEGTIRPITLPFLLITLFMGSLGSSVAYFIYWSLVRKYRISHISPYLFSVPALSILFSIVLTNEKPNIVTILGFALVAAGIFLSAR